MQPSRVVSSFTSVFVRNCSSAASLTCLLWECIITHDNERQYIWRNAPVPSKCLFLFSRYFALLSLILGTTLAIFLFSSSSTPIEVCHVWFGYLTFTTQALMGCLEIVFMLRLYVLYNKSKILGVGLVLFSCVANFVEAFVAVRAVRAAPFDLNCIALATPRIVGHYAALTMTTQGILIGLFVFRRRDAIREGWQDIPVMQLMTRDGIVVFTGLALLAAFIIPYAILVEPVAHYVYPWVQVLLSVATCRIIINMQQMGSNSNQEAQSTLTSNYELENSIDTH